MSEQVEITSDDIINSETINLPSDTSTDSKDRPGWLPEKFQSPEEFRKAYDSLQSEFTKRTQQPAKPDNTDSKQSEATDKVDGDTPPPGVPADLFAKGNQEWQESGQLSDETIQAFEQIGIPKSYIDQYVKGIELSTAQHFGAIHDAFGGEGQFEAIAQWASVNLSPDLLNTFNNAVDKMQTDVAVLAARQIMTEYESALGKHGKLSMGTNAPAGSVQGYQSADEIANDINNPLYQTSEAYRLKVQQKLANSSIL